MDWNAIAAAIESTVEAATDLSALDHVPDSLPSAAFYVGEMDIDMDVTFRRRRAQGVTTRTGTDQGTILCRILVARADDKYAVRKMRKYMAGSGPNSVAEALVNNRTLNGTVHDSHLKRFRGNRLFDVGMMRYYGVEIDLFVIGAA